MIAAVVLTGLAAAAAGPATVRVDRIDFKPGVVRIDRGERVTWRFQEQYVTHNVRSVGRKRFRSSSDKQVGETHTVTFRRRGRYRYVCTLHPGMTGRVVVRPTA